MQLQQCTAWSIGRVFDRAVRMSGGPESKWIRSARGQVGRQMRRCAVLVQQGRCVSGSTGQGAAQMGASPLLAHAGLVRV